MKRIGLIATLAVALLVLPLMYLVYTFYRLYLERTTSEADQIQLKTAA